MRHMRDLGRLALAAVGQAPDFPLRPAGDRVAGIPELRRDPRVGGVLEHPAALAGDDLISKLRPELKIEAAVVDAPAAIRLHVDAVLRVGDHLLERGIARLEADVGHPDQRNAVPSIGAHGAIALLAENAGGFSGRQVADEQPFLHQIGPLRRDAFIVPTERAQAGRRERIGGDRDFR